MKKENHKVNVVEMDLNELSKFICSECGDTASAMLFGMPICNKCFMRHKNKNLLNCVVEKGIGICSCPSPMSPKNGRGKCKLCGGDIINVNNYKEVMK